MTQANVGHATKQYFTKRPLAITLFFGVLLLNIMPSFGASRFGQSDWHLIFVFCAW